jgi:hypothetical protein
MLLGYLGTDTQTDRVYSSSNDTETRARRLLKAACRSQLSSPAAHHHLSHPFTCKRDEDTGGRVNTETRIFSRFREAMLDFIFIKKGSLIGRCA